MDCGLTGSSVHGIFQARVLEWGAIYISQLVGHSADTAGEQCILVVKSVESEAAQAELNPDSATY